jgi:hypothetical protein
MNRVRTITPSLLVSAALGSGFTGPAFGGAPAVLDEARPDRNPWPPLPR